MKFTLQRVAATGWLCDRCSFSHITRGHSSQDIEVRCAHIAVAGDRLSRPVVECNKFHDGSQPHLHAMEQVAWTLTTSPNRVLGFTPPKKDRDF